MNQRTERARSRLEEAGLEALLVTKTANVRYLSGFSGDNAVLLLSGDGEYLVTDGRYVEQASKECPAWEVVKYKGELARELEGLLGGLSRIGFEHTASYEFYLKLSEALPDGKSLTPTKYLLDGLRARKEPSEIESIKGAISCSAHSLNEVLPMVAPGAVERELAARLDYEMMKAGADGAAFDTVVASGPNSSLPHAGITDRVLEEGDLLIIDMGAEKAGYNSDATRSMVLGEAGGRQRQVISAVRSSLRSAVDSIAPGVKASDVDAAARRSLAEDGLSDYFIHSLGHGVGLEVHEKPTLAATSDDVLEPGMVFTVEPGVYIAGWGGVRVEEMLLLEEEGPVLLTGDLVDPYGGEQ